MELPDTKNTRSSIFPCYSWLFEQFLLMILSLLSLTRSKGKLHRDGLALFVCYSVHAHAVNTHISIAINISNEKSITSIDSLAPARFPPSSQFSSLTANYAEKPAVPLPPPWSTPAGLSSSYTESTLESCSHKFTASASLWRVPPSGASLLCAFRAFCACAWELLWS